jgi:hypothetical protein
MNIVTNYNIFQKYTPTISKHRTTDLSVTDSHSHSPVQNISDTDTIEISHDGLAISESKNSEQSIVYEIMTPRLFSNSPESADDLVRFLVLDTINANDATLSGSLKWSLESETLELTDILNGLLEEVGLGNEAEEIIFAEDIDGNIIIEGKIDGAKKKQLTKFINGNKELVERIKDQKAKMEILRGLENNLDISSDEFVTARMQLLNRFLVKEIDISLADITSQITDDSSISVLIQQDIKDNKMANNQLQLLFDQIPSLKDELVHYLTKKPQNALDGEIRYLLKMKQGVLFEAENDLYNNK